MREQTEKLKKRKMDFRLLMHVSTSCGIHKFTLLAYDIAVCIGVRVRSFDHM